MTCVLDFLHSEKLSSPFRKINWSAVSGFSLVTSVTSAAFEFLSPKLLQVDLLATNGFAVFFFHSSWYLFFWFLLVINIGLCSDILFTCSSLPFTLS
jgi:hypothetical protein